MGYKPLFPHCFSLGVVYKTQIFNNVTKPQNNVNTLKIATLFCIAVIFLELAMPASLTTVWCCISHIVGELFSQMAAMQPATIISRCSKICLTFTFTTHGHKPLYPLVVSFKVYTVYTNTEVIYISTKRLTAS